jgi:hypothetical protein
MSDFRSFERATRKPAVTLQPLSDPAGWNADELKDVSRWSYRLTGSDNDEIVAAVAAFRRTGVAIPEIRREQFPLGNLAKTLADVRRELMDGRGIVMIQGFPLDRLSREDQVIGYLGIGTYLGRTMPQNKHGHVLGHVKDLGGDYSDPNTRGYMTRAEMRFHTDPCDYVGLLCLQTAKSGGASRIASSVSVYNRMVAQRPDLAKVLTEDFYSTRGGEVNPGETPWFKQPIFAFVDGYFSAGGIGAMVDKAQGLPGVPPYTQAQKDAIALYRKTVNEVALSIGFERGDIQFLNNHVMLHTRLEYEDWPEEDRKRHLLRLWLSDPVSRPIPKEKREGRSGQGVQLKGVPLSAPIDVSADALAG